MQSKEMEKEANLFACLLLMPKSLIEKDIESMDFDLGSDDSVKKLAKKYDVPLTALVYRISVLKQYNI